MSVFFYFLFSYDLKVWSRHYFWHSA